MITLTTLHDLRCTVRPGRVVAVHPGPPTTVLLDGGIAVEVRETAEEVAERLRRARAARAPRAAVESRDVG